MMIIPVFSTNNKAGYSDNAMKATLITFYLVMVVIFLVRLYFWFQMPKMDSFFYHFISFDEQCKSEFLCSTNGFNIIYNTAFGLLTFFVIFFWVSDQIEKILEKKNN